jgi:hypothetical protein
MYIQCIFTAWISNIYIIRPDIIKMLGTFVPFYVYIIRTVMTRVVNYPTKYTHM